MIATPTPSTIRSRTARQRLGVRSHPSFGTALGSREAGGKRSLQHLLAKSILPLLFLLLPSPIHAQILPTRPVIVKQPADLTVDLGKPAVFRVQTEGFLEIRYQWQKFGESEWEDIAGATAAILEIAEATRETVGQYRVIVENNIGSRISNTVGLRLTGAPEIIRQPQSQSVSLGPDVEFSVFSSGTPPLEYKWYWNGEPLAGANEAKLVIKTEQIDETTLRLDIGGISTAELEIAGDRVANGGSFTVAVRNEELGEETSKPADLEVDTAFTKILDSAIVNVLGFVYAAWADYDGDADYDLILAQNDPPLFENDGRGNFHAASNSGLPPGDGNSPGGRWGDYNNDGDADLFIHRFGTNALYRNDGDKRFTKIDAPEIESPNGTSWMSSWVDYDNDGYLDLFVPNGSWDSAERNFLYRNLGNDRFARIKLGSIANDKAGSVSAGWADYDDDGDLDLFVSNTFGFTENNNLYRNNGDGTFTKITSGIIVNDPSFHVSGDWADIDNDGDLDLLTGEAPVLFYRNLGKGNFERITDAPFLEPNGGKGTWGDYDNDGDLDLFMALWAGRKNKLYRNRGDGTFEIINSGSPSNDSKYTLSGTWVDIDRDGFLDLFVTNYEGERNFFYRNAGNNNHWIRIKPIGSVSNRDGIGTQIRIRATINGRETWQMREITGGSHNNAKTLDAHFGLGDSSILEILRVEWPSGIVQELYEVAADQVLNLIEPERPVTIEKSSTAAPVGGSISLTAHVAWPGPLDYQWQKDRQDIPGATKAILEIQNVQDGDYGRYTVLVAGAETTERVGAMVSLRIPEPPQILWQPQRPEVELGGQVRLEIQATGTPPLGYQWYKDETAITGAKEPWLDLESVREEDAGEYVVQLTNGFGEEFSDPVRLGIPDLARQPEDQSVSIGGKAQFCVEAVGFGPFRYQWQRDVEDIPGATESCLELTGLTSADNGSVFRVKVSSHLGEMTSRAAILEVDPTFEQITDLAIVDPQALPPDVGWGPAWGDFDSDGDLDLFLPGVDGVNGAADNRLFQNNGDGSFTNITDSPVARDGGNSISGCWGDYDNDNDLDLFVVQFRGIDPNFLYANDGNGSLSRITTGLLATDVTLDSVGCGWIDYDNDGWLDMFIANWTANNNLLYRNDSNGKFLPITESPVVKDASSSRGQGWADIDNDGDLDLYVSNGNNLTPEVEASLLYRNDGVSGFTQIFDSPLTARATENFFCAWGDCDNDGDFDLFVANTRGPNFLYKNLGNWEFHEVLEGPIVNDSDDSTGGVWGDYDNDGDLDLFVANGYFGEPQRSALYRNEGEAEFSRIHSGSLANELGLIWSATWVDYDNNGFLDLFLTSQPEEGQSGEDPPTKLFRNNLRDIGPGNHWIQVKCVGTHANRSGIGTKVRIKATIGGKQVWQLRQLVGGGSAGNTSVIPVHFGLGDAEIIDTLRIEWPGPAFTVQELHDVQVDQILTVLEEVDAPMEPKLRVQPLAGGSIEITLTAEAGKSYDLQVSSDLIQWESLAVLGIEEDQRSATYVDPAPPGSHYRYYRVMEVMP